MLSACGVQCSGHLRALNAMYTEQNKSGKEWMPQTALELVTVHQVCLSRPGVFHDEMWADLEILRHMLKVKVSMQHASAYELDSGLVFIQHIDGENIFYYDPKVDVAKQPCKWIDIDKKEKTRHHSNRPWLCRMPEEDRLCPTSCWRGGRGAACLRRTPI